MSGIFCLLARPPLTPIDEHLPERTLAGLDRYRRLSKDYDRTVQRNEGIIYLASIHERTKRLASDNKLSNGL